MKAKLNQKKCLFIDQYPGVGGGQVIFLNLLAAALDSGCIVTAAFPHGGELERRINAQFGRNIRCVPIAEPKLNRGRKTFADAVKSILHVLYFLKFVPLLKEQDLIYANGPRYFLPVWVCSWGIARPFVYHLHLDHSPREKSLIRRIAESKNTRAIIANSKYVLDRLKSFHSRLGKNQKLLLIENSLSPSLSVLPFCDRFRGMDELRVAIVGRISQSKGQDIVLQIAPRFEDFIFFIIGEPEEPFTSGLRAKMPANVTIHPPADDIVKALDAFRVHFSLIPSRTPESFGMVGIESMAASCITIVSGAGALREIAARTSCYVYDSLDGLVAILNDLRIRNSEELQKIAQEQFTATRREYHYDRFRAQIAGILNQ